jgi:ribosomal protein S18 acetylase RimI-like enzyme
MFTQPYEIRAAHLSDLPKLYEVCLRTGDNGNDGSHLYNDPELVGHYFTAPYVVLEPDLAFVLTRNAVPCGYVLGTSDSAAFGECCEREWFPVLRQRYPQLPPVGTTYSQHDQWIVESIHAGYRPEPDLADYPAHLHIDILPVGQGQGWGRRLIETLLTQMRNLGVPAVHLGVGKKNTRAIRFYEKVGFHVIKDFEGWVAYGMRLG